MEGNKFTLILTNEQQKQILAATGQSITKLTFEHATDGALSDQQLDGTVGGTGNGTYLQYKLTDVLIS